MTKQKQDPFVPGMELLMSVIDSLYTSAMHQKPRHPAVPGIELTVVACRNFMSGYRHGKAKAKQ